MLRHLVWSAVLGPSTGIVAMAVLAAARYVFFGPGTSVNVIPGWGYLLEIAVMLLFLAYVWGLLPSLAAGFANGLLASRLPGRAARLTLAAAIGAGLGLATLAVIWKGEMPPFEQALFFSLAGAVASLVPVLVAQRTTKGQPAAG